MALHSVARCARRAFLACCLIVAVGGSTNAGAVESKIVGGAPVPITSHPYQVALLIQMGSETFQCGGSIRDATHVVTAAHCVVDEESGTYPRVVPPEAVTVGHSNTNFSSLTPVAVSRVSVARGYLRDSTSASDAAVLTLAGPITLDTDSNAIPFASDAQLDAAFAVQGRPSIATGWGATTQGGSTSDTLLRAELPLQPDAFCQQEYGPEYVPAVMLCAGGLAQGGKDTCQGDSGGPLAIDITPATPASPGDLRLAGITSFGNGCGIPSTPGAYAWVQSEVLRPFLTAASPVGPPAAPASNPTITGTSRVGQTVTCNAPPATGGTASQFLWYVVDGDNFTRLATTNAPTLRLPASALGAFLVCDVRYESAGGFSYSDTPAADRVGPVLPALAPPAGGGGGNTGPPTAAADTVRPSARVSSARCRRARCTIKVRSSDVGGQVRSLRAKLSYKVKRCRRVGGRRRCRSVNRTKRLRARRSAGGFTITVRLKPGRYTVSAVATDTSNNRSATARKRFRVKRG